MRGNKDSTITFEPPKEVFRSINPSEVRKHSDAARLLIPLSAPPEIEFLRAYAETLEGKEVVPIAGENPKAIARGIEAAKDLLPVTTSIRKFEKFLAASYRGSFKSDLKTEALRANARKPRQRLSDPRSIRQPLTVSQAEMDLVRSAVEKTGQEMSEFIRETVLKVCIGEVPFIAPPVVQSGGRNKQYQVRWSEEEWQKVGFKTVECYGPSPGRRGHSGNLIRDVILEHAGKILAS